MQEHDVFLECCYLLIFFVQLLREILPYLLVFSIKFLLSVLYARYLKPLSLSLFLYFSNLTPQILVLSVLLF